MNLQDALTSALTTYGVAAIFLSVLISSVGLPLPTSFLLILAGAYIASGDLSYWPVIAAALAGAVIGDHLGYGLGIWGGRSLAGRISRRLGAEKLLARAEANSNRWGGIGVFLSRWLITAVAPYINLTCGITRLNIPIFSACVIVGEALWVLGYVYLGQLFSSSVAEISDILGEFSYVLIGLAVLIVLGYQLVKSLRKPKVTA